MDWRYRGQILVVNYVNGRSVRRPSCESALLCALSLSRKERWVFLPFLNSCREATLKPQTKRRWQRSIEELHKEGVVVIHDVTHVPDNVRPSTQANSAVD